MAFSGLIHSQNQKYFIEPEGKLGQLQLLRFTVYIHHIYIVILHG